ASNSIASLLSHEHIRLAFNKIDGTIEYRASNQQLDEWKKTILAELNTHYPMLTKRNIFRELSQSKTFIAWCESSDLIDYTILSISGNIILSDTSLARSIPERRKIIGDILSINDRDKLLALYNFYIKTKSKEDGVLFFSILIKLYMNQW